MRKFDRIFLRAVFQLPVFLLLISLSGCGYHVGSISHPQIKTVAIADVKNESYEVLASAILRDVLAERFQFDNSLKLTSLEKADCIVYARIVSVSNLSISWKSTAKLENYRANEYTLIVKVEYTVLIPGSAKPLVKKRNAAGGSTYLFAHDPAIGRSNALKQCMLKVADSIVAATTEAW